MENILRKIFPPKGQKELVDFLVKTLSPLMSVQKAEVLEDQINVLGEPKDFGDNFYFTIQDELLRKGFFSNVKFDSISGKLNVQIYLPEALEGKRQPFFAKQEKLWLNILLFVVTIFSTVYAEASFETGFFEILDNPSLLWNGVSFSFCVLAILLSHEFGHYFAAVYHRMPTSLPFFIPMPFLGLIGTMGAFIKMRARMENLKKLLDVGAAGPIAGFVVCIPVLVYGIATSSLVEISPRFLGEVSQMALVRLSPYSDFNLFLGEPLAMKFIKMVIWGEEIAEMTALNLNGVAFAGWVGLLVTSYNLMPVGQLDGGHILYATFPRYHKIVANVFWVSLLALGYFTEFYGWFVWAGLLFFMKLTHPPVLDYSEISKERKVVSLISLIIFILCFTPIPVEISF